MTATPTPIQKILTFNQVHQGQIEYSQVGAHRLSYDKAHMLSATDCSGLIAKQMEYFAHRNVGTYTGNECSYGELVTTSKSAARAGYGMLPGDCILFDWDGGNWDHIAMYAGGGRIWNHGGPGPGPNNWSLAQSVDWAVKVMVRRFVPWPSGTITHPPVHSNTSGNPMHNHPIPSLIARGTGDYYGLISGPNESHGGAYYAERWNVHLIQHTLNWKFNAGLNGNGLFYKDTADAVAAFQRKYMPGTEFYGQVWFDDWAKLASF